MHVGLFTPLLLSPSPGGAERATFELARAMRDLGHQVTLLYSYEFDLSVEKPFYKPQLGIQCRRLPRLRENKRFAGAVDMLKKLRLDVLCAFVWDYSGLLVERFAGYAGVPFIYAERSAPDMVVNEFWNAEGHALCAVGASAIVLQMESYRKAYPPELQGRITVIPNCFRPAERVAEPEGEGVTPKILLFVGKLDESIKNVSVLLYAFALLHLEFPDWRLCLCGDGRDRDFYTALAAQLGLGEAVIFKGNVSQIGEAYAHAHIFCIPSLSEGFPNVLGEAHAHGLPCVGFAACSGVNELIVQDKNGFLAPETTATALARGLRPLMKSAKLRRLMGARALAGAARFDGARVFAQWEELFRQVSAAAPPPLLLPDLARFL